MSLVDKYRGGSSGYHASNISIDSLSTLESIKSRQGWMIAAQVATVVAIANQTRQTVDAINLVNNTLYSIENTIQKGFDTLENSIVRLEANIIENLNEIKWYLFNIDKNINNLINLVKFSGATRSAEYNKQGFILYKIGNYKEAVVQLDRSLSENPLNIEAYINLGFVYLQLEKIDESIKQFETASKIIKEDFSYYEEVSSDSIRKTEIFILDNLAELYALKLNHQSAVETQSSIIGLDNEIEHTILAKYKLAKFSYLNGDLEKAFQIIKEFIDFKYFKPVALAISNNDFINIRERLLIYLQDALQRSKDNFINEVEATLLKIKKTDLPKIEIEKIESAYYNYIQKIQQTSEYELILSEDFRIKHDTFLNIVIAITELYSKLMYDVDTMSNDNSKLSEINSHCDSENKKIFIPDRCLDIKETAHQILLKDFTLNVIDGINAKVKTNRALIEMINLFLGKITECIEFYFSEQLFNTSNVFMAFMLYFDFNKIKNNLIITPGRLNDSNLETSTMLPEFLTKYVEECSQIFEKFELPLDGDAG